MGILRSTRRLARIAGVGLAVAAISQEMSKPESERTWTGRVFGLVPYDFRPPTWQRIREAYWNPDSEQLFTSRPLGVGWAVNLYRVRTLLGGFFGGAARSGRLPDNVREYTRRVEGAVTSLQGGATTTSAGRRG